MLCHHLYGSRRGFLRGANRSLLRLFPQPDLLMNRSHESRAPCSAEGVTDPGVGTGYYYALTLPRMLVLRATCQDVTIIAWVIYT